MNGNGSIFHNANSNYLDFTIPLSRDLEAARNGDLDLIEYFQEY